MLIMSRREGETILIGEDIEVVIAHIGRSRVRVGIRAPRSTLVIAREVKLVREENLSAAESSSVLGLMKKLIPPLKVSSSGGDKCFDRQEAGQTFERISQCSPFKPT
ncbi:MAG: carbon storage regulator, CsrA [Candidatus Solibacter sp.]|jgi:carbon storage regulator|nr:carbon storage regulator, CsrA [Candidatus Solibacter sp.]